LNKIEAMKSLKLFLGFVLISSLFTNCTNDSASDLVGDIGAGDATYTLDIKPIIDNNCIMCHAATPINGAPMSLVTYEQVKDAILNRPLVEKISKAQGEPGMMPYGGTRLPQASINLIIKWQQDGLLE
jgi:uncharacterized membrane protein